MLFLKGMFQKMILFFEGTMLFVLFTVICIFSALIGLVWSLADYIALKLEKKRKY